MKKYVLTTLLSLFIVPIAILGVCYILLSTHYADTFMFGVYINDVYVADMTPAQVNDKLLEYVEPGKLIIEPKEADEIELDLVKIGYRYSYLEQLKKLQRQDNPIRWAGRMLRRGGCAVEYTIEPIHTYDEELLDSFIDKQKALSDCSKQDNIRVQIQKTKDGYVLIDDTLALLDRAKAQKAISNAIIEGKERVDLAKEDCYIHKDYTPQMRETLELWEQVERLQSSEIIYHFGEDEEVITASDLCEWIKLDEDGGFYRNEDGGLEYDEEKIKEYVKRLADKYDTVNEPRTFQATNGRTVTIKNSNYGNELNQKAEVQYLLENASHGTKQEHTPEYLKRAFAEGQDDIGDTYIEVDMTNQIMYYYRSGRCVIETPVVTGNTRLGRGTPEKVCYVYYKQRHRVLRGADYATPVSYWIAVNGAIGIHDASWRSKFGGTIYKSNGSHGCINTPTKEVSRLYDMVEIGTPVLIFY